MTDNMREMLVPIAISVPFFGFGFAITANMLELTAPDIVIGVSAGFVCGVAILGVLLYRSTKSKPPLADMNR